MQPAEPLCCVCMPRLLQDHARQAKAGAPGAPGAPGGAAWGSQAAAAANPKETVAGSVPVPAKRAIVASVAVDADTAAAVNVSLTREVRRRNYWF